VVQEEEDDAHECKHQWPSEPGGKGKDKSNRPAPTSYPPPCPSCPSQPRPTRPQKKTQTLFPVPSSQCSVLDNWINYDEESKSYNKYFFFF
jgi:hypothetical protein